MEENKYVSWKEIEPEKYIIATSPERSDWVLYAFGNHGIMYCPPKTDTPNWFYRKMGELLLGVKWKKVKS